MISPSTVGFIQKAFGTTWLTPLEWLKTIIVASTTLILMEIRKFIGGNKNKLQNSS